jgi:hypothetical protein
VKGGKSSTKSKRLPVCWIFVRGKKKQEMHWRSRIGRGRRAIPGSPTGQRVGKSVDERRIEGFRGVDVGIPGSGKRPGVRNVKVLV